MSTPPDDFATYSLLAVFAHPDDESFACGGVLAWCAARGARVTLLCATRGEEGRGYDDPAITRIRSGELEAAARLLGIAEVLQLDYPDGSLREIDYTPRRGELEADILRTIELVRPDVIITFAQDGLYWHPDHIALHQKTTAVVAALRTAAPALYYVTLPRGTVRAIVDTVEQGSPDGRNHREVFGIDDPDAFGVLAPAPTLVVDVGDFAATKVAALRCHRSQLRDGALSVLEESEAARLLRVEQFTRAPIPSTRDPFIERLARSS
jgi:LmbE family N-acetylglucosaminyl deacetylase